MDKLLKIINDILEHGNKEKLSSIEKTDRFTNLGLESLDLAELTVRLEAEYDVDIFEDGIVQTVGEVLEKLETNE